MSKINQIEKALQEIDATKFHKLVDAYLSRAYSYKINSNGTKLAEDKPAKGTPDSFVALENGEYIFIEYTAQKTNIVNKFLEDLEKCFDKNKTGISTVNIQKIILACNSDLNSKEIESLKNKCLEKNIECTVLVNSLIANELFNKYPSITKDFLNISVDSGQILDYHDFIKNYDSNKYSTPINTLLQCREDEFQELYSLIATSNIVLVTGLAGIGKTKLSIEACNIYAKENDYQFKAILNRGTNIFDDMKSYFNEDSKNYLIFIDDVNRIPSALEYIQEYFGEKLKEGAIKIVATVRDYAKAKISQIIPMELISNEFELSVLSDDAIKTIVKNEYNVTNPIYLDRIIDIAGGNPRLALMTASLAKKHNTLDSIYNVTSLYDEYFSTIKDDLEEFNDENFLKAITIVAFFRTIDKENSSQVELIENTFNISINDLWIYINKLHHLEIFDLHENEVVKISDQILSTYLFYKIVFVDKKIEFYTFLEHFFPQYKARFIDILNPILNTFDTQYIISVLKEPVDRLWNKYIKDESTLYEVMKAFWFIKQTDILIYLGEKITNFKAERIDINSLNFWNNLNNNRLDNPILERLSIFKSDTLQSVKIAIELILLYFQKKPSELQKVLYVLINSYGFKYTSYRYSYDKEYILLDTLWSYCNNGNNQLISKLFIQVCRALLKTEFEDNKFKGNQFILQRFKLVETEELKSLRSNIFKYLQLLFAKTEYQKDIVKLIQKYPNGLSFQKVSDVEKWDSENIINFIQINFDISSYKHVKIVHEYLNSLDKIKIYYDLEIRKQFKNQAYELEKIISLDDVSIALEKPRAKDNNIDWDKIKEIKKTRLAKLIGKYTLSDWEILFERCQEFYSHETSKHYKFENNMKDLFNIQLEKDQTLYIRIIKKYLEKGNPFNLNLNLQNLIEILGKNETYTIIQSFSYNFKDAWLFQFYQSLPLELACNDDIEILINLYKKSDIQSIPNSLDYLKKYFSFEPSIFVQVVKILKDKTINENIQFLNGVALIFNSFTDIFQNLEIYFKNDIKLLKESYLLCINMNNHFDHDSKSLNKLINLDNTFLEKFLNKLFEKKEYISSHDIYGDFSIIWSRDDYETIFFDLIKKLFLISKTKRFLIQGEILQSFFSYKQGRDDLKERINNVIKKYIDIFKENEEKMIFIFEYICELSFERRKEFIVYFLEKNSSYEIFAKLSLESNHRSWSGSLVPELQKDKDYYNSLLEPLSEIKFLKHKQRAEKHISYIEKDIEREKKKDFMSDY